ncbi:helix-turn-helix transcriptional regulator [Geobacter sp.]|uniref:helix-turn-helix domain-containing protein n=1 Tax=Geobacter sp. TaxID=46610 RepID=UPI002613BB81|nr:helix-turn-helix transcriptional regulator [Geobacter sp.]
MCTFSYFSLSRRHTFSIAIPLQKQPLIGYPEYPLTLGEHIRKKRMDLGLLQREVAEIIGVTESSIWNWEHGVEPVLQYNPKIINFLGYIPFDCPDDTIGWLAWYKKVSGLTLIELGKQMGRHPDQLQDWLSGERKPFNKSLERIEQFLSLAIHGLSSGHR